MTDRLDGENDGESRSASIEQSDGQDRTHWKDQETCQGCGAERRGVGQMTGEPLRAIKLRSGVRDLFCEACFVEALRDGRVHPDDPRHDHGERLGVADVE